MLYKRSIVLGFVSSCSWLMVRWATCCSFMITEIKIWSEMVLLFLLLIILLKTSSLSSANYIHEGYEGFSPFLLSIDYSLNCGCFIKHRWSCFGFRVINHSPQTSGCVCVCVSLTVSLGSIINREQCHTPVCANLQLYSKGNRIQPAVCVIFNINTMFQKVKVLALH